MTKAYKYSLKRTTPAGMLCRYRFNVWIKNDTPQIDIRQIFLLNDEDLEDNIKILRRFKDKVLCERVMGITLQTFGIIQSMVYSMMLHQANDK